MDAKHEARKASFRDDTRLAWQIGNFVGAAFVGKLKDLNHYLKDDGPKKPQSAKSLLETMRAVAAAQAKKPRTDRAASAA